jgi:peptidoglycan hydrolase-like protein with peptidoglycan-binding domain
MNTKSVLGALLATTVVLESLPGESRVGEGYKGQRAMPAGSAQAAAAASPENPAEGPGNPALSLDTVREAQEQLRGAGFDPGPPTGAMDIRTREAIRKYQSVKGLPVSGELDEETLGALRRERVRT